MSKAATSPLYNFAPASSQLSTLIYGSQRPAYPLTQAISIAAIKPWLNYMQTRAITRVCCLLDAQQLSYYSFDLMAFYQAHFGAANVLHSPIDDFHLATLEQLKQDIFPFLQAGEAQASASLVHCSAGLGRTGHVLAAWLVHHHHVSAQEALAEVVAQGRNPYEALCLATKPQALEDLLTACAQD